MPIVAVVSDSHLPRFGRRLPAALIEVLTAAAPALILHLGDHTDGTAVEELAAIAPVEAVAGNNDPPELVARFGVTREVAVGRVRVGLTHGHLGRGRTTPDRALATFTGREVDVVAFGHSHIPLVEWRGDVLLVNPGSPTDRRRQPRPTIALLDVPDGPAPPAAAIVELPLPGPQPRRRAAGSPP
jgi:putative phosphoesterase